MNNLQETKVAELLIEELKRANRMYGTSFSSPHEGYAVMLEEMDELWAEIMKKNPDKTRMREEAIQVGAMAIKFVLSCTSLENVKCRTCQFRVMTINDRKALGEDPCEHCCGSSRWISKAVDPVEA